MTYNNNNIFSKIIKGELSADKIYEDEKLLAFRDINPVAQIHVLVIPKGEYLDYSDFITNAASADIAYYFSKIAEIIKILGVDSSFYRLITNKGVGAGQTVMHFHTHIIAGDSLPNF